MHSIKVLMGTEITDPNHKETINWPHPFLHQTPQVCSIAPSAWGLFNDDSTLKYENIRRGKLVTVKKKCLVGLTVNMSESSSDCQACPGSGLHHAEYKAGPEAGPFEWEDAGRLLGTIGQTAWRYEVSRPTASLRQGQHPARRHAENTTKVRRTILC